jgi:excisionase family DNA binding protein
MSPYPHLSQSLPQLATPEEVAPLLGMTRLGVVRHCRTGKLPGVKVGGRWLVHVRKLAAQLDGDGGSPADPRS